MLVTALNDARDRIRGRSQTTAIRTPRSLEPVMIAGPAAVLYIEDNASNVHLMDRLLGSRPAVTLLQATDGHSGLKLARERRPASSFSICSTGRSCVRKRLARRCRG